MSDSDTAAESSEASAAAFAEEEVTSVRLRFTLGLVSLLHYATLGALLPLLPLFLRETLGLTWTDTGIVLAGLPLGVVAAPHIVRLATRFGIDARTGLAGSHLAAAGLVMVVASMRNEGADQAVAVSHAAIAVLLYSTLLTPSFLWLPELAGRRSGVSETAWRLWGAIGFVAPAWVFEVGFSRVASIVDSVASHELALIAAGWLGVATVVAALAVPAEEDRLLADMKEDDGRSSPPGILLLFALLLMIVLQRVHSAWTAPFFADVIGRFEIPQPIIHRLCVVSGVFEVAALYGLGFVLSLTGARIGMIIGILGWAARSVLLAWVAQTPLSVREALCWLMVAQALYGLSLVGFFGSFAAMSAERFQLLKHRRLSMFAGIVGAAALVALGTLTDAMVSAAPESISLLPLTHSFHGHTLNLRGWSGVWWQTALPAMPALLFALFGKWKTTDDTSE